jgi:hypothetical protein
MVYKNKKYRLLAVKNLALINNSKQLAQGSVFID